MRTRGKKLGLLGMLFAAGASIMGCGATSKPVDEIETLRNLRRNRTAESVRNFSNGISTISQNTVNHYANTALDKESKDMELLDKAKVEREKTVQLGNELYQYIQNTIGGKAPKYSTTTNASGNDSSFTIYGTATGRLDGKSEPIVGGEIEYKTNGTYYNLGIAPQESTTESNASCNLTRSWNSLDICVGKYKKFGNWSTNVGIGVDQESISTEGTVGITYIDDEDTKNTPYVELGLEYNLGKLNLGFDVEQTVVKGDDNNYTTTGTVKLGVKF